MSKYTVNVNEVEKTALPGREVWVLSKALQVERMTLGICKVSPHSSMDPHSHSQEELIYVMDGNGYVEVAGTRESLKPGTLIHLPSGSTHVTVNEGDKVMKFIFCFSPQVEVGSYDNS
jgi:quercetin dioxygenase-like cupin family protein